MHLFIPVCVAMLVLGHFENIGSANYITLPNVNTLNIFVHLFTFFLHVYMMYVSDACHSTPVEDNVLELVFSFTMWTSRIKCSSSGLVASASALMSHLTGFNTFHYTASLLSPSPLIS